MAGVTGYYFGPKNSAPDTQKPARNRYHSADRSNVAVSQDAETRIDLRGGVKAGLGKLLPSGFGPDLTGPDGKRYADAPLRVSPTVNTGGATGGVSPGSFYSPYRPGLAPNFTRADQANAATPRPPPLPVDQIAFNARFGGK